jgi:hypothetical protein
LPSLGVLSHLALATSSSLKWENPVLLADHDLYREMKWIMDMQSKSANNKSPFCAN